MADPGLRVTLVDLQAQRRRLGGSLDAAMARVLDHGQFILGPEVEQLEGELARFCGAGHAIACASGTDALLLALMAWSVGPGDAVFVPSFTFAATAEVVALVGATPVFVDIQPDTFTLDAESMGGALAAAGAAGLRPVAVIAVDLFGQPADYGAIRKVADAHGLWVLADAAQSFGATLEGHRVGSLGDTAATSFFPSKPLGCYGDGGAVFTDDEEVAARLRSLRNHGTGSDKYDNVRVGTNSRLDTLQAAILLAKLAVFEDELGARQGVADRYREGLADVVEVPSVAPSATSAWACYTIRVAGRDRVIEALRRAGVASAVYYARGLHQQTAFRHHPLPQGGLAVSEHAAQEVLSLPMHPYLDSTDQDLVIDSVRAAVGSQR